MYEYDRPFSGLGWTYSSGTPDQFPTGRNVCFRSDEESFASAQGCRPAYGMGCRKPDGSVARYPCCPGDNNKTLWECPPGRPGTSAGSTPLPEGTSTASRAQVRELQRAINATSGCSAGTVDGRWGPNTERGFRCYMNAVGAASVSRRFPWAAARAGGTPEVGKNGAPTPSNGGAVATTTPGEPTRAGLMPFTLPGPLGEWWFWLAAAGVVGLGVVGYTQLKKKDEEDELGPQF
jgi:hypothetical protein